MNTSRTLRRAAATTVLAGTAVLAAAPAYAGVPPEDLSVSTQGAQQSKAQIERDERAGGTGTTGSLAPNVKAQVERMERAMRDPQGAPRTTPIEAPADDSSPVSWPVVAVTVAGIAVAGAGGFTVRRFRHHGHVGAPTAA